MKRIITALAIAASSVFFLSSCEPDPSTEDWMNKSAWEARLEGAEVALSYQNEIKTATVTEGWVGFMVHKGTGYYSAFNFMDGKSVSVGKGDINFPIEYGYPEIRLPYSVVLEDGSSGIRYNTGTISDDLKSIVFKEYTIPHYAGENPSGIADFIFHDITFKRVYSMQKN